MILVDTNVLSAMMRVAAEPAVEQWFDAQPLESVWTTTITIFEIRFGLALLTPDRRRDRLDDAFDRAIDEIIGGRVLPIDRSASEAAAANCCQTTANLTAGRDPRRPDRRRRCRALHRHFESLGIILVDPLASLVTFRQKKQRRGETPGRPPARTRCYGAFCPSRAERSLETPSMRADSRFFRASLGVVAEEVGDIG
jgi:hypothetical protein